jgi:hypothetical protein
MIGLCFYVKNEETRPKVVGTFWRSLCHKTTGYPPREPTVFGFFVLFLDLATKADIFQSCELEAPESADNAKLLYVRSYISIVTEFFSSWRDNPLVGLGLHLIHEDLWFLDHTQRHTTVGRTLLVELLVRRRDLYLTTHNTHNRQTSVPPVGFEPTISAGERPLGPATSLIGQTKSKCCSVPDTRIDVNFGWSLEFSYKF